MTFILFLISVDTGVFGKLKSSQDLVDLKNETAALIFSEDGKLIGKFFDKNRTNISFESIPQHLIDALLATEDVRYFKHTGVDSYSLLRVLFKSIIMGNRSSGGGSTITQQLAKNLLGRKRGGVFTMAVNKAKEAIQANRIERVYNKEEILALYLNTVPFGENVFGIEAASGRFFNKKVSQLLLDEAAILVGILKANTFYNPRLHPENALLRRNVVLSQMHKYDYISEEILDSIKSRPIALDYANLASEGPANYFLTLVKAEAKQILDSINKNREIKHDILRDGLRITTTLNAEYQEYALNSFSEHLSKMQILLRKQYASGRSKRELDIMTKKLLVNTKSTRNVQSKFQTDLFSWDKELKRDSVTLEDSIRHTLTILHAGLLALDPKGGGIKIYVGGIDFITQPYDQIKAFRQLASTFKPILYSAALETGYGPCDYLRNDSIVFEEYDNWVPQNYDHSIGGKYSMAAALAKSMNIPTVYLYEKIGNNSLESIWRHFGFSKKLPKTPSVALGTVDASIYELAIAYAAFANGGKKIEPYTVQSIQLANGKVIYERKNERSKTEIISKESADIMTMMLRKAVREGTGVSLKSKYNINIPLAGKTGTSQNYSDAWFASYNPNIVMISRVGASSPQIHFNNGVYGSGGRLALPLVALTFQQIQDKLEDDEIYDYSFYPDVYELEMIFECEDYKEIPLVKGILDDIFKDFRLQRKEINKRKNTARSRPKKTGTGIKSNTKKKKKRVWKRKKKHFK